MPKTIYLAAAVVVAGFVAEMGHIKMCPKMNGYCCDIDQ